MRYRSSRPISGGTPSSQVESRCTRAGFPHHHRDRRERQHPGSPQLTRARHVPHVADTTEHQRIEIVAFHAGEDFRAPFGTQPREVDAGVVLEAHHADEHPAVTGDGAHALDSVRFVG